MLAKIAMLLTFLAAAGCVARPAPPLEAANISPRPVQSVAEESRPPATAEVLAQANQAYDSQLGALRGGHFDTERQIGVLKQAVLLYGQFLERAEGRPELEPAVRKSRERIADAQETIAFLEASLRAQDESPPAHNP